jgi:hypothetical protein
MLDFAGPAWLRWALAGFEPHETRACPTLVAGTLLLPSSRRYLRGGPIRKGGQSPNLPRCKHERGQFCGREAVYAPSFRSPAQFLKWDSDTENAAGPRRKG